MTDTTPLVLPAALVAALRERADASGIDVALLASMLLRDALWAISAPAAAIALGCDERMGVCTTDCGVACTHRTE